MQTNETWDYRNYVFLDETALAAYMNPENPHYLKARSLMLDLDDLDRFFVTTNYIVFDVHEWLRNEFGYQQANFFLNTIDKAENLGRLKVILGSPALEMESRRLLTECPELHLSLSEALTSIVMSTYKIKCIFTFNSNYYTLYNMDKEFKLIPSLL